jgi:hypothetical protein
MIAPRPHRELVVESAALIERAHRAIAASRVLLSSSAMFLVATRLPVPPEPRQKGFADLAAWNARKR